MNIGGFFKKFGQIALQEAPLILMASGLPPELAPAITIGVTAAKAMKGASNVDKAKESAELAKLILAATNSVLVSRGHKPLVDTMISNDALDSMVKATYDISKMKDEATIDYGGTPPKV